MRAPLRCTARLNTNSKNCSTAPADTVIKPATIVGAGGVFQRTREMLRRLPVLPLFYADRRLQTIWIEDVCQGLVRTVERSLGGTLLLAHPESTPMREFYRAIAAVDGIRLKVCPFPGDLALFGIRLLERIGLKPPDHVGQSAGHQTSASVRPG